MKKLRKTKKAMLFAVGFMLLGFAILALAVLIFHNSQDYETMTAKLLLVDRVYELDTSISNSIAETFNLASGISINIDSSGVSFVQDIPNSNKGGFNVSMHRLVDAIHANLSNIAISIDEITNKIPLTIQPLDIAYQHENLTNNIIRVIPQQTNFDGYSVVMTLLTENITSCGNSVQNGTLSFKVEILDTSVGNCSYSGSVDTSFFNKVYVNGNTLNVSIENTILTISADPLSGISAETNTTILSSASGKYVSYPDSTIVIDFTNFGVYKESTIILEQ